MTGRRSEATKGLPPNPWILLPTRSPFVVPADRPYVEAFQRSLEGRGSTLDLQKLDTTLQPEPYVGNPLTAEVVFLQSNPSKSDDDHDWHRKPDFRDAVRQNLAHRRRDHPFYLLDPRFDGCPGSIWWNERVNQLMVALGRDVGADAARACFTQRFSAIEFHGYHACNYRALPITLPSQRYNFALVDHAMNRNVIIIVGRSWDSWMVAVPGLSSYRSLYRLSNPQSAYITPGNLTGPHGQSGSTCFAAIVRALGQE